MRRTPLIGMLATATLLVTACGDDSSDEGSTAGDPGGESAAATGGSTDYPLTVETCGEDWTYEQPPEQVVTTDTAMLDLMLLLDLDDHVAGFFENNVDNVHADVVDQVEALPHLGDAFPYPTLEAVMEGDPDLVLSYGYNPEAGFTADRLQELGINNFTFDEGCSDFTGPATLQGYYDDVRTLGQIFDVADRAEALIGSWEDRVTAVQEAAPDQPVAVLNTGSGDPSVPFASGGTGVTQEIIEVAGGENIFADIDSAFFEPSWEEVVDRDPELIVESSGFGEDGLDDVRAHLQDNPALATMTAAQNDAFISLRYQEGVPGPQLFDGMEKIAAAITEASADE